MSCVVALKLKEKTKAPEMGILVGIEIAHLQARILLLFHYELSKVFTTLPFCPRQIKALLYVGQKPRLKRSILTLMAERLESNNFSNIQGVNLANGDLHLSAIFFNFLPFWKMLLDYSSVSVAFVSRKRIWQSLSNKFFDVFALTFPLGTNVVLYSCHRQTHFPLPSES